MMITRTPLRYESPAQIVRLWHYGFNVPLPVYWYALSQSPIKPQVQIVTISSEEDDAQVATDMMEREWQKDDEISRLGER